MKKPPAASFPVDPNGEVGRVMTWALAAATGLSLAACERSTDQSEASPAKAPLGAKECCVGKNECKGKGGCAVPGKHACSGKNDCKGQGGCNMNCAK